MTFINLFKSPGAFIDSESEDETTNANNSAQISAQDSPFPTRRSKAQAKFGEVTSNKILNTINQVIDSIGQTIPIIEENQAVDIMPTTATTECEADEADDEVIFLDLDNNTIVSSSSVLNVDYVSSQLTPHDMVISDNSLIERPVSKSKIVLTPLFK